MTFLLKQHKLKLNTTFPIALYKAVLISKYTCYVQPELIRKSHRVQIIETWVMRYLEIEKRVFWGEGIRKGEGEYLGLNGSSWLLTGEES